MTASVAFNGGMDRLRDFTMELLEKKLRQGTWDDLQGMFDPKKPKRFISGVAVSTRDKNTNGLAFDARGFQVVVPNLLLWNHELHVSARQSN